MLSRHESATFSLVTLCNFEDGWDVDWKHPKDINIAQRERKKCHFLIGFMESLVQTASSGKENNELTTNILINLVWSKPFLSVLLFGETSNNIYLKTDVDLLQIGFLFFLGTINVYGKIVALRKLQKKNSYWIILRGESIKLIVNQ